MSLGARTDMASKSCLARGVDHCLSSCQRRAVDVNDRNVEIDGRTNRLLRGLNALEAMMAGLIIIVRFGDVSCPQAMSVVPDEVL